MTATLTACPGARLPVVPQPSELSGTVSLLKAKPGDSTTAVRFEKATWNLGEQPVKLAVLSSKSGLSGDGSAPAFIADGTVSAGGQLSLKLPQAVDAGVLSGLAWTDQASWNKFLGLMGSECKGAQPTMSDPAAQGGIGVLLVTNQREGFLLAGPEPLLKYEGLKFSASAQAGTVMYVDRPTTLSGTVTCAYDTSEATAATDDLKVTYTVNLTLKRGWNSVVVSGGSQGQQSNSGDALTISGNASLNLTSQRLPGGWMMPVAEQGSAAPLSISHPLN